MAAIVSQPPEDDLPSSSEGDEEEVIVKSKSPKADLEVDDPPLSLDDHIETPPNGNLISSNKTSKTKQIPTLEIADINEHRENLTLDVSDPISQSPLFWESQGEFGLSGQFKINGKKCTLRLEDDQLQWTWENKENNLQVLSLADIFAVTPTNARGRQNQQSSKFTIYALKSQPGSCGELLEIICQPLDPHPVATTQTWVEFLSQQIQNFGHRPRRLYIMINPIAGNRAGLSTWAKVEHLFQISNVHTEIFISQRRFHAREVIQSVDIDQYDGIIVVGGDGTFNEILNGLMLYTQQTAGVNLRRNRFVLVQPNIRLGIIPAGFSNSIAWSILGTKCPRASAAQILLGCSSPIDVSSLFNTGQLLLFSAGALSYGLQAEIAMLSQDFTWLGNRRIDIAQIRALLSNRDFEAEISYIPVEEHQSVVNTKSKCYSRCPKCSDYTGAVESPGVINEKGASVLAAYSNVDRPAEQQEWKQVSGRFSTVIACPLTCRSQQAPQGISPWAHQANGCTDLILVRQCSKIDLIKWFLRQKRTTQLELPYVEIHRVKEFKFREILIPPQRAEEEVNLVTEETDDDEATNRRGGARLGRQASRDQSSQPTSHWNIDGDDLNRVDIEVRIHRHSLMVFARGVEPLGEQDEIDGEASRNESIGSNPGMLDRSTQFLIPS